jgi:hypothetical protein
MRVNLRNIIIRLTLIPARQLAIGDLVTIWGDPSHIAVRHSVDSSGRVGLQAAIYFQEGLVIAYVKLPAQQRHYAALSPAMPVSQVEYYAPSSQGNVVPIGTPRWSGFGTNYRPDA